MPMWALESTHSPRGAILRRMRQATPQGGRAITYEAGSVKVRQPTQHEAGNAAVHEAGNAAVHEAGSAAMHKAGSAAMHEAGSAAMHDARSAAMHEAGSDVMHEAGSAPLTRACCIAIARKSRGRGCASAVAVAKLHALLVGAPPPAYTPHP
eukprot:74944-Chlamydomonas_euryale.AAC.2